MKRRAFLGNAAKLSVGTFLISGSTFLQSCVGSKPKSYAGAPNFSQAALPYAYNGLEPYIDAATMELHYSKHAAGYTKNMNDAIAEEKLSYKTLEELLANIGKHSVKLRNNAGGHYNHESFWKSMTPGGKAISTNFTKVLETSFGSVSDFKNKFAAAATGVFGSGWAWLIINKNKQLEIVKTANQDNPLMNVADVKGFPILGLDVWEHAYYLKYQNKRADYITNWWNVVNWEEVEKRYNFAISQ